jgi:EpsI family protein
MNKRFIIVVLILATVSVISAASYLPGRLEKSDTVRVSNFPMRIGEWTARDMPLSQSDYQILETTNVIRREYKNPAGDAVILYIIYSEKDRKIANPPELYYMGSGATVVKKWVEEISPAINANRMMVDQGNTHRIVVYWFKAGNLFTENYVRQQLKIAIDHMLLERTSGAMVRLSIDIKNNDEKSTFRTLRQFARQIEPLLPRYLP